MAAAAASVIVLTACGTNPTNAQIGTATGVVLGGVAGSALGGGTLGTVGGAAAGAVIGNEVGKRQDEALTEVSNSHPGKGGTAQRVLQRNQQTKS